MNNDENKKGMVSPKKLNESEQKEIAGGERMYLRDIPGVDDVVAKLNADVDEKLPLVIPGAAGLFNKGTLKNGSYIEFDDDDPENAEKIKVVFDVFTKTNVKDLSPEERQELRDLGLL